MSSFNAEQLDDLQDFLRDWLRHSGRTQADLRRALRAPSIRMPVLIEELRLIHAHQGLIALAERLCGIEQQWQGEELSTSPLEGPLEGEEESEGFSDAFGQLDLLLQEIRQE